MKRFPLSRGGAGKSVVLGVDLWSRPVNMVKIVNSRGKRHLAALNRIEAPENAPLESDAFSDALRAGLKEILGRDKKADIWTVASSANADFWHLVVPKVPEGKLYPVVLWNIKKEKDIAEEECVLDFEVLGAKTNEEGEPQLEILAYLIPKKEVETLNDLFKRAGYPLKGITLSPFAVQTVFRSDWHPAPESTYASFYLGKRWTRIDIFSRSNLIINRGVNIGLRSLAEAFVAYCKKMHLPLVSGRRSQPDAPERPSEPEAAVQPPAAEPGGIAVPEWNRPENGTENETDKAVQAGDIEITDWRRPEDGGRVREKAEQPGEIAFSGELPDATTLEEERGEAEPQETISMADGAGPGGGHG